MRLLSGLAGPLLGGWRLARRDPLLARDHPVRGDVRTDHPGADLHAGGVRRDQQRRSLLGDRADAAAGHVRHVLRLPHLLRVRAGAECHPAGAGLLLPHSAAVRRDLAHRGHARGAEVSPGT